MISKNYKKVAIIEKVIDVKLRQNTNITFKVPINLDFTPSRILAHTLNGYEGYWREYADSKYVNMNIGHMIYDSCLGYQVDDGYRDDNFWAKIKAFDKNSITFSTENFANDKYDFTEVKIEIISIE